MPRRRSLSPHSTRTLYRAWVFAVSIATMCVAWTHATAGSPKPPPPDEAFEASLVALIGEDAHLRRTDHFAIAYDTAPEIVAALVARLEGTYDAMWRYCEGLELKVAPPEGRLGVLLFDKYEGFKGYREACGIHSGAAAGFYHHGTNLSAFGNTQHMPEMNAVNREIESISARLRDLARKDRSSRATQAQRKALAGRLAGIYAQRDAIAERFNRFVIQHEAAHQMFFNIGVHVRGAENPLWLVEGLACQFEVPQARSAQGVGRVNHMRLADLRDALGVDLEVRSMSDEDLDAALRSGRMVSLRDLIGDADILSQAGPNTVFRYAQAWGFVHYLNRAHRDQFAKYVTAIAQRQPGVSVDANAEIRLFESHFGPAGEALMHDFAALMLKLRLDRREAGR